MITEVTANTASSSELKFAKDRTNKFHIPPSASDLNLAVMLKCEILFLFICNVDAELVKRCAHATVCVSVSVSPHEWRRCTCCFG